MEYVSSIVASGTVPYSEQQYKSIGGYFYQEESKSCWCPKARDLPLLTFGGFFFRKQPPIYFANKHTFSWFFKVVDARSLWMCLQQAFCSTPLLFFLLGRRHVTQVRPMNKKWLP